MPTRGIVVFDDLRLAAVASSANIKFCLGLVQRCDATIYGNFFTTENQGSLVMLAEPKEVYAGSYFGRLDTPPVIRILDSSMRPMDAQVAIGVRMYDAVSGIESSEPVYGETVTTSVGGVATFANINIQAMGYYKLAFNVVGSENLTVATNIFRVLPSFESLTCTKVCFIACFCACIHLFMQSFDNLCVPMHVLVLSIGAGRRQHTCVAAGKPDTHT